MLLSKAKKQILEQIFIQGEYSHNIVSIILRIVAEEFSPEVTNQLVKELRLSEVFNIEEEPLEKLPNGTTRMVRTGEIYGEKGY